VLRDPTRGGVASATNEIATKAGVGIELDERSILVSEPVRGACELLGLDPLYVANEGVAMAIVAPSCVEEVIAAAHRLSTGSRAAVVGDVTEHEGAGPRVHLRSGLGTSRPLIMLTGDQLPRIC
jgi:hydrogenase expression/formation protein HypE